MKSVYGLTREGYELLLAHQGHACPICLKAPCTTSGRRQDQWNVDHCHETKEVRGLLCQPCNSGIGQLKDDPALIRRAVQYIEQHISHGLVAPSNSVSSTPVIDTANGLPEGRYCSRCRRDLPASAFSPSVLAKSKKRAWCTTCHSDWERTRRNGETAPPATRRVCEAPECTIDITHMRAHARWCSKACTGRGWRHENPSARRDYWVKTLYGITSEQADAVLVRQGDVCAICRHATSGQWNIDHCHDTDAVRGILCSPCNTGIGFLGDEPETLHRAVAYLEDPPARQLVR